jgi:repressor LexA
VSRLVARLAELRAAAGLSQADIARSIQTSQPAVARLESGQTDVRLSTLARYAQALNVSLDFVAGPDGPDDDIAPPPEERAQREVPRPATEPSGPPDLSWRQQKVLRFIRDSLARNGYPPSMREIAEEVGLASTSSVSYQLSMLQSKGYLRRDPARRRAVEVEPPGPAATRAGGGTDAQAEKGGSEPTPADIPVLGSVAAGRVVLAGAAAGDAIRLPEWLTEGGALFAATVNGKFEHGAPIADGDVVVVRRQPEADNGAIVLSIIDGETTSGTLNSFHGQLWFMPHDSAGTPVRADKATIVGRAVAILRKL